MSDDWETELDRLLAERGAVWREAESPARGIDPSLFDEYRARSLPRWMVPLAAAAAVTAVVAGTALLVGGDDRGARENDVTTNSPDALAGVVPWKVIDPRDMSLFPYRDVYTPDPTIADGLAACTDDQLVATSKVLAAGGTTLLEVRFIGTSGEPCSLASRPEATLLGGGEPLDVRTYPLEVGDGAWTFPVYVDDESAAVVRLAWPSDRCGVPLNDRLRLAWDDNQVELDGFGVSRPCTGGADPALPGVDVGWFTPEVWDYELEPAPIEVRQVDVVVPAGSDVATYVVELVSPKRDLSLGTCPDATVVTRWSFDDEGNHRYGLNCEGVPYRDDDGVPYLPQGEAVRFAVEVPLDTSENPPTYTWVLSAVDPITIELVPPAPASDATDQPRSELLVEDEEDATVVLHVGNESSTAYVDVRVMVDDEDVAGDKVWNGLGDGVAQSPAPKATFLLGLEPGQHAVTLAAGGKAETFEVDVPESGKAYVSAMFMDQLPGDVPSWSWMVQDRPVNFL